MGTRSAGGVEARGLGGVAGPGCWVEAGLLLPPPLPLTLGRPPPLGGKGSFGKEVKDTRTHPFTFLEERGWRRPSWCLKQQGFVFLKMVMRVVEGWPGLRSRERNWGEGEMQTLDPSSLPCDRERMLRGTPLPHRRASPFLELAVRPGQLPVQVGRNPQHLKRRPP